MCSVQKESCSTRRAAHQLTAICRQMTSKHCWAGSTPTTTTQTTRQTRLRAPVNATKDPLASIESRRASAEEGEKVTTLADLTSRTAVDKAVAEYERLGRDDFLARYGFRRAKRYFLYYHGHEYDSKAIVAVAHGYQHPHLGPLTSAEFSGGNATVRPKLESLGFEVRIRPD